MLVWALFFNILCIVAAVLGFGGVLAPSQGGISRVLFFVFLVCFIVTLVWGLMLPRQKREL